MKTLLKQLRVEHWFLAGILLFTFLMRFPSLFEPFWYGDEGIFAAVARNLNFGGVLYLDAWDNKPPMIYLTYQAIFKFLGVSMFSLRLVTLIVVLATVAAIYEIGQTVMSAKKALIAAFIFGFLTSLRIIEGNLALTEIFMILPISLAFLVVIKRNFDVRSLFIAGVLFAIASLYKQVGVLEAAALGIYLFLMHIKVGKGIFDRKNVIDFFVKAGTLALGFFVVYLIVILYFLPKGLVDDYIFAAYTYYRIYLGESPRYALLINILKFLPIVAAVVYGLWKVRVSHPGGGSKQLDIFHLLLLWMAFSFLGSYFSGRTYGHYLVQAAPALSLVLASITTKIKFQKEQVIFAICFFLPLIFLTKILFTDFLSGGPLNQVKYWSNFLGYFGGAKSTEDFNNFFDRNVNSIMAVSDYMKGIGIDGKSTYIWGDWPWLYAIADLKNPSRFVTSFHVFGVPIGKEEVISDLVEKPPEFIIKPTTSIGYFKELELVLDESYTLASKVDGVEIFVKNK